MGLCSVIFLAISFCTAVVQADKSALIIVGIQNSFLSQGTVPVANGEEVIPILNQIRSDYGNLFSLVALTQEWHCKNHVSFASQHAGKPPFSMVTLYYDNNGNLCRTPEVVVPYAVNCASRDRELEQMLWPDHCVIGSWDAEIDKRLKRKRGDVIIKKGVNCQLDSYSAFFDNGGFFQTKLDSVLRQNGITDVYIAGLALDFCVYQSSLDAKKLGYKTYTVVDASRGAVPDLIAKALADLEAKGVHLINAADIPTTASV